MESQSLRRRCIQDGGRSAQLKSSFVWEVTRLCRCRSICRRGRFYRGWKLGDNADGGGIHAKAAGGKEEQVFVFDLDMTSGAQKLLPLKIGDFLADPCGYGGEGVAAAFPGDEVFGMPGRREVAGGEDPEVIATFDDGRGVVDVGADPYACRGERSPAARGRRQGGAFGRWRCQRLRQRREWPMRATISRERAWNAPWKPRL